jgi:alcohol dehydrogenase class IV
MEIDNFSLASLPKIHFGKGEFKKIIPTVKEYGKNVALIIGGNSFKRSSYYSELISNSETEGIKFTEVSVQGEPSPEIIDTSCKDLRGKDIDIVLAIGGGSVLDAGKAISAMLKLDDSIINYLEGVGDKIHPGIKVPFIAVPTTSGTGSECTKNAVISRIGAEGFKKSLRDDNFIPDVAIVDPELTISCPLEVTAACGLDAITQLIGAYLSTNSSVLTDSIAISGLKAGIEGILTSLNEPGNIDARTKLSYASICSGIVLANAGLGLVHGFASPLGAFFPIPHGVACGTLLGVVIEENIKRADDKYLKKYAIIGRIFANDETLNQSDALKSLMNVINTLIEITDIKKLSFYGIKEGDLELIVENSSLKNNPVHFSQTELKEILLKRV